MSPTLDSAHDDSTVDDQEHESHDEQEALGTLPTVQQRGGQLHGNLPALSDFTETATFMDDRGISYRFVSSPGASMGGDSNLSDRNVTPYYQNPPDDDDDDKDGMGME